MTADEARQGEESFGMRDCEWLIVIGGTTVPGRYLGGKPLTLKEMKKLAGTKVPVKWLLGPVVEAGLKPEGYDHYAGEELEHEVYR